MSVAAKEMALTRKTNLDALKSIQPYLMELLEQIAEDLCFDRWTVQYKGPYVELRDGEDKLRFVENTNLCYNCISKNQESKSAIVLGLGLGSHFLNTFAESAENLRIICCELDPVLLYWAFCLHDFSYLISKGRLFFIVGEERSDRDGQWRQISPWVRLMGKIEPSVYVHKQYSGSDILKMKQFLSEYRGMLLSAVSTSTIPLSRNLVETAQTALNAYIYKDRNVATLQEMQKHWKGKPAIVVSAGPSLDKQIELLKEAQHHCVIIANDVISNYLIERGIIPHVIAALDYSHVVYDKLEKAIKALSAREGKPVLAFGSKVYPKLVYEWPGPLFPNQSDAVGPKACEILGLNSLNVGSSVAHFCYSVAQAICPKEVIFVGQDLAYGEGGRTHSSGFAEGSAPTDLQIEVTSWDGLGTVKTNRHWYGFLTIFEHTIASSSVPVYNCTEGGARMNGAIHVPFKERLKEHAGDPAPSFLKGEKPEGIGLTLDNQRRILREINGVLKDLEGIRKELIRVRRLKASSRSLNSVEKSYGAALEAWRDIFYKCEFLLGVITSLRFSASGDLLGDNLSISTVHEAKEIAELFLEDVEFAKAYLKEVKRIWGMFSPILKEKDLVDHDLNEQETIPMHELWLAVASSGDEPWWDGFLGERFTPDAFLELVVKAYGAYMEAPLDQMIQALKDEMPSWLYGLCRSWYDFLYRANFGKYIMFLSFYGKAEQFFRASKTSERWLYAFASLLSPQLRALAPFVKISGGAQVEDYALLSDLVRAEALYWEGRRKEFLSEVSKLLDRFKEEIPLALAVLQASGGTWVASIAERTMKACMNAGIPMEKFQEKFLQAFGISVKFEPVNADK